MYIDSFRTSPDGTPVVIYSPSDLITFMTSPYASWMDHYVLLHPNAVTPDAQSADQALVAEKGNAHEQRVLEELRITYPDIVEIPRGDRRNAAQLTAESFAAGAPAIFQAFLEHGQFAGWADFIIRSKRPTGEYVYTVWDTKLARSVKPYFAIQLCCYAEMLEHLIGVEATSDTVGVILGTREWKEFRLADYRNYYQTLKQRFLAMHNNFNDDLAACPEPLPGAEHRQWNSHAKKYFLENDHLSQVAGITSASIKKLVSAGITTMEQLARHSHVSIPKMSQDMLKKLSHQAALQVATRELRQTNPDAKPVVDIIQASANDDSASSFSLLPDYDPADVYFDLEGYPLVEGGLEYLWGVCYHDVASNELLFRDWWAHDAEEEKSAFVAFITWVYARWKQAPGMHIYHYAAYELSVVRRLSTKYAVCQDEVDSLLRNNVFVDLYVVVRRALRLGEDSYSIKRVERLYRDRAKRDTDVATAGESIIQYARWLDEESERYPTWKESKILSAIRDYNEDDCRSTFELAVWLRDLAHKHGMSLASNGLQPEEDRQDQASRELETALRNQDDPISQTLADLVDFHRREAKPMWWTYFDRLKADYEQLWDDHGCIAGVSAVGEPSAVKKSWVQNYKFDPMQDCKIAAGAKSAVRFTHIPEVTCAIETLDLSAGSIGLKVSQNALTKFPGGCFPAYGSLIPFDYVNPGSILTALQSICVEWYDRQQLPPATRALLTRRPPAGLPKHDYETTLDAMIRVVNSMDGDCLVVQGPPGTGKTFTAARVIVELLRQGKKVGITSNGHKAIMNLLRECGITTLLAGFKVGGGDEQDQLFTDHPNLKFVASSELAATHYDSGVIAGTAWLFTRNELIDALDYVFIDEAGQVSLANAVAMSRCAKNLILMGDQMQLEQPIQGAHPGDAKLSVLQYYLKDDERSTAQRVECYPVVPPTYGLFLGESRRMHPSVCKVVSELAYEDRLKSHPECENQRIVSSYSSISSGTGVLLHGVEHEGNIQQSDEEIDAIVGLVDQLCNSKVQNRNGDIRQITLDDILCIAPYNAQVRALQHRLGQSARVGSVDKFQGQEAAVCIVSLCSSYGEYGSRGLKFILDPNRLNVAISRAQCMAIVVADPRIAATPVSSIEDLQMVNGFCKIVQAAI